MGRPKLKQEDKKVKLSITLDKKINLELDVISNNKSKFIEELIINYLKNGN
jgi:metal-responsive CopG/Arc/MetJ family transcriptional regulator